MKPAKAAITTGMCDTGERWREPRKISLSLQLSEPSDYEGGDLMLEAGAGPTAPHKGARHPDRLSVLCAASGRARDVGHPQIAGDLGRRPGFSLSFSPRRMDRPMRLPIFNLSFESFRNLPCPASRAPPCSAFSMAGAGVPIMPPTMPSPRRARPTTPGCCRNARMRCCRPRAMRWACPRARWAIPKWAT